MYPFLIIMEIYYHYCTYYKLYMSFGYTVFMSIKEKYWIATGSTLTMSLKVPSTFPKCTAGGSNALFSSVL